MKPDWKDAPEWAEWLSQERDGEWRWYSIKPHFFDKETSANFRSNGFDEIFCSVGWRNDSFSRWKSSEHWSSPINFEQSLEERPNQFELL